MMDSIATLAIELKICKFGLFTDASSAGDLQDQFFGNGSIEADFSFDAGHQ